MELGQRPLRGHGLFWVVIAITGGGEGRGGGYRFAIGRRMVLPSLCQWLSLRSPTLLGALPASRFLVSLELSVALLLASHAAVKPPPVGLLVLFREGCVDALELLDRQSEGPGAPGVVGGEVSI